MAKQSKLPIVLTAGAAFFLLGRGAKGAYQSKVNEEVMKYRDTMYNIGPNCEITLKQLPAAGEEADKQMELLWSEFVEPIIHEEWAEGEYTLGGLTTAVMKRLFPESQCVWPPTASSPESQAMAFHLMERFVAQGLACDPEDTSLLPEGQVCMTEVIPEDTAAWLEMSMGILKALNPTLGTFGELFFGEDSTTISYRAPAAAAVEAVVQNAAG